MRVETRSNLAPCLLLQERWAQENIPIEVRPVCVVEKEIVFTF